jgi:hypothetical protein
MRGPLGHSPPSAFLLAAPAGIALNCTVPAIATRSNSNSAPAAGTVTGSGTADFVPLWTSSSNIGNSVRFQSDSGPPAKVGFNTSSSSATLDVPAAEPGSCGFGWRRL